MDIDKYKEEKKVNDFSVPKKQELHTIKEVGKRYFWVEKMDTSFDSKKECIDFYNNPISCPLNLKYKTIKDWKTNQFYWFSHPEKKFKEKEDCWEYWEKQKK